MKPRQGDLVVGLLLVLIVLGAYQVLIGSRSHPPGPAPAQASPTRAGPTVAAQPRTRSATGPARREPAAASILPSPHAAGHSGAAALFFQDYLKGILIMEARGRGLSAAQAGRLLPMLRAFTADSRFHIGYYDRFPAAQQDIWSALAPAQQRWLKQHHAGLPHSHAPPERAAGAAAERLRRDLGQP